jgi:hypothetical protein
MSSSEKLVILTICPSEQMDYELREILHAIGVDVVSGLVWGVGWLDWVGAEEASKFNNGVDMASGRRVLVTGKRLLDLSEQVWQTIEGEFVGYRTASEASEFVEIGSPLARFTTSLAFMAIEVKDGYYFDMYLRSQAIAERLADRFQDVRWQDPADFILERGGKRADQAG